MKKSRLLAAVIFAVVITAVPAKACSCAIGDPRDALAQSDAAFIGTLVSQTPDPGDGGQSSTYRFTVDEAVKGEFGGTVDVHSASNGAACGLEVPIGGQTGLFLTDDGGVWWSSLCAQIDPDELRDAAQPLPEPDGQGPIKLLVSGSYGEAGIIALDAQGRTLAYGEREPESGLIHVCPGSGRFLEIYGDWRRPDLAVRETASLDVLREIDLPIGDAGYRHLRPTAITCDEDAGVIYVAALKEGGDQEDVVFKVTGNNVKRIYRGKVGDFYFDGMDLYLTEGGRARFLVKLDLATPERDGLATVPDRSVEPRPSPNGRWVVLRAFDPNGGRSRLIVVNTETGRQRSKLLPEGFAGDTLWVSNRRIAFLPGGYDNNKVQIYSRSLQLLDTLNGQWYTTSNVLLGDAAFGVGWGSLYKAPLLTGPVEVLRNFDTPSTYYLEAVPDEVFASP
jgi:hypothetical protein